MSRPRRLFVALLLCVVAGTGTAQLRLKRIAWLPLGYFLPSTQLILGDTDHDGLGEIVYWTARPTRWEIVEYRPVNRYEVVQSLVGTYPPGESVIIGNFQPDDIGDIDRDGKPDLVGEATYVQGSQYRVALCTVESRDSSSYPDTLNWWIPTPIIGNREALYADLDGDSLAELLSHWAESTSVFENVGDDRESLVCTVPVPPGSARFTVDDYDQNGRPDYTFKWNYKTYVIEHQGGNNYAQVCSLYTGTINAFDRFGGHDVDQNGKLEFFEVNVVHAGMTDRHVLYQFEATGEHTYTCDSVDTATSFMYASGRSLCADVDGDSLEEVVWSIGDRIHILKPTGPHNYERVSTYRRSAGIFSTCNTADFNGNGYNEIYVGGDTGSFVLEVECIKVVYPDTARSLVSGDTCEIRWRTYTPPRCDSVSLFLRTDTTTVNGFYRLDTIAHGLSPTESTYAWVVPDTTLDTARILAIAYGPGWQFDESDMPFRIAPAGVAGPRVLPPREWGLSVSPIPGHGTVTVRYDVPRQSRVAVGVYDVCGRMELSLADGTRAAGTYSATLPTGALSTGVHFVRLDNIGTRISRKIVLTE